MKKNKCKHNNLAKKCKVDLQTKIVIINYSICCLKSLYFLLQNNNKNV